MGLLNSLCQIKLPSYIILESLFISVGFVFSNQKIKMLLLENMSFYKDKQIYTNTFLKPWSGIKTNNLNVCW